MMSIAGFIATVSSFIVIVVLKLPQYFDTFFRLFRTHCSIRVSSIPFDAFDLSGF